MNDTTALDPARTASPQIIARLIGVFTLLTVLGGVYAQGYVSQPVPGARCLLHHAAGIAMVFFGFYALLAVDRRAAVLLDRRGRLGRVLAAAVTALRVKLQVQAAA